MHADAKKHNEQRDGFERVGRPHRRHQAAQARIDPRIGDNKTPMPEWRARTLRMSDMREVEIQLLVEAGDLSQLLGEDRVDEADKVLR